jgi:hypothetical protein
VGEKGANARPSLFSKRSSAVNRMKRSVFSTAPSRVQCLVQNTAGDTGRRAPRLGAASWSPSR